MSGAMTIITNYGIRGWLPRSICLICLTLMWLESVLGLCLGCEIHGLLVRRGWVRQDAGLRNLRPRRLPGHLPGQPLVTRTWNPPGWPQVRGNRGPGGGAPSAVGLGGMTATVP